MEKLKYTHKYQVLKTSWGIVIFISGTLEKNVTEMNVTFSEDQYTKFCNEHIELGIQSVFSEIGMVQEYNIHIEKIDFNHCHFQEEALFWAARSWISSALNLEVTEPEIFYDKISNKYLFKLPA